MGIYKSAKHNNVQSFDLNCSQNSPSYIFEIENLVLNIE